MNEQEKGISCSAKESATCENTQPAGGPPSELAKMISERKLRCIYVPKEKMDAVNIELKKLGAKPCPMVEIPTMTESQNPESAKLPTGNASGEKCVNLFVLFSPEKFVEAITAAKEGDKA